MLKRISPVTAAVALGLLLAIFALVAVLAQRGTRLAATNTLVDISGVALPVAPGQQRCSREYVPGGADRVRIYASAFAPRGQPVAVTVHRGGEQVSAGRVPGGYPNNSILLVPLRPVTRRLDPARVCVRNLGSRRARFAGNRTSGGPNPSPRVHGEEAIRFDWLLPGRPAWADLAPKIATRFAAAKPTFVGAWTFWALGAVLLVLWAATIALVVREARR